MKFPVQAWWWLLFTLIIRIVNLTPLRKCVIICSLKSPSQPFLFHNCWLLHLVLALPSWDDLAKLPPAEKMLLRNALLYLTAWILLTLRRGSVGKQMGRIHHDEISVTTMYIKEQLHAVTLSFNHQLDSFMKALLGVFICWGLLGRSIWKSLWWLLEVTIGLADSLHSYIYRT